MKKEVETYFYLDGLTVVVEELKNENIELKKELEITNDELAALRKRVLMGNVFLVMFIVALAVVVFFK